MATHPFNSILRFTNLAFVNIAVFSATLPANGEEGKAEFLAVRFYSMRTLG
jgi:hypothetical protein